VPDRRDPPAEQPTRREAIGGFAAGMLALGATFPSDALADDDGDFVITANGWVMRRDDLGGVPPR
jgi:hypothetical protein